MDPESLKRQAGEAAASLVEDGMVVGLGTGSTVKYTIEALGQRVADGLQIVGIPTSEATEQLATKLGIPLTDLDNHPDVDLTIDGADEFDPELRLIKGGGGALTREKIVARQSKRMVVVADARKEVDVLGSTFALPVEVIRLGLTPVKQLLERHGATVHVRMHGDAVYHTDNGHPILDAKFDAIENPEALELELEMHPAVVCSGLFLGICDTVYVAREDGVATVTKK